MSERRFEGYTEVEWMALREDALRLKARMGMERKAAKGILHGCAPLGYKNGVIDGEKVIVIDPETAPKVRELFRLAAKKGMTIRKLVPLTIEMGLRSCNGKLLGPSAIHGIITNTFYCGSVRHKDEMVLGAHQVFISKKAIESVQSNYGTRYRR